MIQKDFFNQTSSHLPGAQYQFKCSGSSRMQTSVASEFHTFLLLLIGVASSCSALASFLGHKGTFRIDNRTPGSGRQRRPSIPSIPGSKKSNMGSNGSGGNSNQPKASNMMYARHSTASGGANGASLPVSTSTAPAVRRVSFMKSSQASKDKAAKILGTDSKVGVGGIAPPPHLQNVRGVQRLRLGPPVFTIIGFSHRSRPSP